MMMKTMMTRPTRDPRSLHLRTVDTSSPGQKISRYHLIMSSSVEINSFVHDHVIHLMPSIRSSREPCNMPLSINSDIFRVSNT